MDRNHNILFGMLAVQLKKVTPERITRALEAWAKDSSKDLPDLLVEDGTLTVQDRDFVLNKVIESVATNGGDSQATLINLGNDDVLDSLVAAGIGIDDLTIPGDDPFGEDIKLPDNEDLVPAVKEWAGRYTDEREFASGGMGRILLVRDEHFGRDVALKELLPDRNIEASTRTGRAPTSALLTVPIIARFLQEARITGNLEHPSIVPVYELGYRDDGRLYYTMKLVRGQTLHDVLAKSKSLEERIAYLPHFVDLCNALAYAHSRGVIHRDIKPMNVMVGDFGETVVIDWGIAKVRGQKDIHAKEMKKTHDVVSAGMDPSITKTVYGEAMGSPYFMAPEQAQGKIDEIDERSDTYALGTVLYSLLSGQVPYLGCTVKEFLQRVVTDDPRPIRDIEPKAPPELVAICEKAMQKDPDKRYQKAKDLVHDIEQFLSGATVGAYQYSMRELVWRFVKKHATFLVTASVSLLVLAAVIVYSYINILEQKAVADELNVSLQHANVLEGEARAEAQKERDKATAAEAVAVEERNRAEQELYYANISLSERCLKEQRLSQARELLAKSPEKYRHWEWGRLEYLCNADQMTLKAGGYYVTFLPDGDRVLTVSTDGTIALYNAWSGEELATYAKEAGYGSAVDLTRDGRLLAVSTNTATTVWDVKTAQEVFRFDETVKSNTPVPRCLTISPDGKRLAALGVDRQVRLWDIEAKTELGTFKASRGSTFALVFNPAGNALLFAESEFGAEGWVGTLSLRDPATGAAMQSHSLPPPQSVHAAVFSPDGRWLAVGTESRLLIWDIEKWKPKNEFEADVYYPRSMAFSPDSTRVAAGSRDGTLNVWDLNTGEALIDDKAHLNAVYQVMFGPDSNRLATAGDDRTATIWNANTGRKIETIKGHALTAFSLSISPKGNRLATASYDGTTKFWAFDADLDGALVTAMAFNPSRKLLAGSDMETVKIWDSHSGRQTHLLEGHVVRVRLLDFDAEGKRLATLANESVGDATSDVVTVWEVDSGREIVSFDTKLQGVLRMNFSSDGSRLALKRGTTFTLYDAATGQQWKSFDEVDATGLSPDGHHLAVASKEKLKVYGLADAKEIAAFEIPAVGGTGMSLAFNSDGSRIAAGLDLTVKKEDKTDFEYIVRVWDVGNKEILYNLEGHKGHVTCLAFTEDGQYLATGDKAKRIKIWDMQTGGEPRTLIGHASDITFVLFGADGKRIVTGSMDGTFKIWDCDAGRELITLQDAALAAKGKNYIPSHAQFSTDGLELIAITEPEVLQPIVLRSFPWDVSQYPGKPDKALQERVELYKRSYWSESRQ